MNGVLTNKLELSYVVVLLQAAILLMAQTQSNIICLGICLGFPAGGAVWAVQESTNDNYTLDIMTLLLKSTNNYNATVGLIRNLPL